MNLIRIKRPGYLQDLQDEMNRMIEDAFSIGATGNENGTVWRPAVELNEQNGNYQLRAELPGMNKDNINVEVSDDAITINAETKKEEQEKKGNVHSSEFRYGKFMRTVHFPSEVDNDKAKADFKDGVLTVTVPKTKIEESKTKKINVD
jgi:HSP20 family protein